MDMLQVHSLEDVDSLPLTAWNIHQPASADGRENPLTSGAGLDLILVPGLGFTEASHYHMIVIHSIAICNTSILMQNGFRIGRGKVSLM